MDNAWLHEDVDNLESSESDLDSEKDHTELEERLYAITHHNNQDEPLAPDIAKHYSVQYTDNGEVVVALNTSLDDIKSEENGKVLNESKDGDNVHKSPVLESVNDDSEVVIVSQFTNDIPLQKSTKRPRYSDVNLDKACESKLNGDLETSSCNIDFFKINPSFLNSSKNKQFKNLNIPKLNQYSDWKSEANESFISIKPNEMLKESEVVKQMTASLKKINPDQNLGKLNHFARVLYRRNMKNFRRKERVRIKKALKNNASKVVKDLPFQRQQNSLNGEIHNRSFNYETETNLISSTPKQTKSKQSKQLKTGSISLNISPFVPDPSLIDLISEDEESCNSINLGIGPTRTNSKSDIPLKWSKEMIRFYTKPSRKKFKMNMSTILENFKKTTVDDDWWLDPRDQTGIYKKRIPHKTPGRRCTNCREYGHFIRDCPKPKKIQTCSLCGQHYHIDYNCPNRICRKCGVFLTNETYDGECSSCYFTNINYDITCKVCGKQGHHRSEICTDLWRRFHATTGPGLKIPEKVTENSRKYCCNCARKGHFSHDCPFPGDYSSTFITNYANEPLVTGTTEVSFDNCIDVMDGQESDAFLQNLSNSTFTEISVDQCGNYCTFIIGGTFEQCKKATKEIQDYVNIRKRKRQEPFSRRKKRRIRY